MFRQPVHLPRKALTIAVAFAAFFFAADLAAWHAGILLTKLGNATLFGNISSFFFAAWGLWLARKWPSSIQALALTLAAAGCGLLMWGSAELSAANLRGDLLAAFAGLLYTGYLILVERTRGELQPLPLLFLASLFGAAMLLPAALAAGERIIPADWTGLVRARPVQPGRRPGAAGLCARPCPAAGRRHRHADPAGAVGPAWLDLLWRGADRARLGGGGDDRRRAGPGPACRPGRRRACTSRSPRPISAAMPTPLEALRLKLALAVGENAVFDGWTHKAVDSAAAQLGIDPAQARLAFPKDAAAA